MARVLRRYRSQDAVVHRILKWHFYPDQNVATTVIFHYGILLASQGDSFKYFFNVIFHQK